MMTDKLACGQSILRTFNDQSQTEAIGVILGIKRIQNPHLPPGFSLFFSSLSNSFPCFV